MQKMISFSFRKTSWATGEQAQAANRGVAAHESRTVCAKFRRNSLRLLALTDAPAGAARIQISIPLDHRRREAMSTYYDYLKERVRTSSVRDQAELEHLVHLERNALWQQLVSNPAYDERGRMSALAAFDEAASYILSEQSARLGRPVGRPAPSLDPGPAHRAPGPEPHAPERGPSPPRSIVRDVVFLLIGMAIGFAIAYFAGSTITRLLAAGGPAPALGVEGLAASQKSFKFVKSEPSPLEGRIGVEYASGAPSESFVCEVDATYKQLLEYAKFDKACKTVAFKFRPLSDLWANFNYLEGYMMFTATIMSPEGGKWQGSTSVYFSIDSTT